MCCHCNRPFICLKTQPIHLEEPLLYANRQECVISVFSQLLVLSVANHGWIGRSSLRGSGKKNLQGRMMRHLHTKRELPLSQFNAILNFFPLYFERPSFHSLQSNGPYNCGYHTHTISMQTHGSTRLLWVLPILHVLVL